MKNLVTAAIIALAATSAQAGQSYACKDYGFLGQTCKYTGTTTKQDVVSYIEDAKTATSEALQHGGQKVYYTPERGRVTVFLSKERYAVNVFKVSKEFKDRNLSVKEILVVSSFGDVKSIREFSGYKLGKGYTRWSSLREHHQYIEKHLVQ